MGLFLGSNMISPIELVNQGGHTGKYQLLQRIKDDSNNDVGTVVGFFTDSNDVEYAVVCLDAQYRGIPATWCSEDDVTIPNLTAYGSILTNNIDLLTETATENTQAIIDWCGTHNATSAACNKCRLNSFVIGGVTYYGQLPNMKELTDISMHYNDIEELDPTSSSYSSLNFSTARDIWSSNQQQARATWYKASNGGVYGGGKGSDKFVCPILELPNAI